MTIEAETIEAGNVESRSSDRQFEKAASFATDYVGLAGGLRNVSLRPVAEAFERNVNRLRTMAKFPGRVSLASGIAGIAFFQLIKSLSKVPGLIEAVSTNPNTPETNAILQSALQERLENVGTFRELLDFLPIQESVDKATVGFESMHPQISAMISQFSTSAISDALHALLAAQIIGSWTAFETLVGDLWIVAVNECPRELVKRMAPSGKEEASKWLPFRLLMKHHFDLRRTMGNVLVESRKVSFKTLDDIRSAYRSIFRGDAVMGAIDNRGLDILHAVRNALVHRSGFVDDAFKERMKGFDSWGEMQVGAEIELSGAIAADLTGASITSATTMMTEVDNWITTNPDPE
ncbi:MAG TPA: hypothetical protein VGN12_20930 [Pirellulales bacterium]|jgi:hypothetical protein